MDSLDTVDVVVIIIALFGVGYLIYEVIKEWKK